MTSTLRGTLTGSIFLYLTLLSPVASVVGQTPRATVSAEEENFRREPGGRKLATVFQGAVFPVTAQRDDWVEVELEGWIWAPSVTATDREGFDLVVSAEGGENLRVEPQGTRVARLLEGFLLERVDSADNWVHVRRRGWLWRQSIQLAGAPAAAAAQQVADEAAAASDQAAPDDPPVMTAPAPITVHANPDGDTVAVFQPGAQAQILGRTGDWVRVRVDGWVFGPTALDSAPDVRDTGDLTPAQLRAEPGRHKGALVRWRVQFISLRRAEPARSDFEEGEPFLLARGPAGEPGFVYLAVPDNLLDTAEQLRPLQHVTVVGRVRTGRSTLLASPIIDLTDIELEPSAP